jgi:hypothetical protein
LRHGSTSAAGGRSRGAHLRLLVGSLAVLAAGSAAALPNRQTVFEGPLRIGALTLQTVRFEVPGAWMIAPRLEGRIVAKGGRGNDVELLVLRAADLPDWE